MNPLSKPLSLLRAVTPWPRAVKALDIRPVVRKALATGGLQEAVRFLNTRVPHRYTAIHRLVIDQMASLAIHDLEGGDVRALQVPVDRGHSFCQYAIAAGCFVTQNSAADSRLDGHVAQGRIAAYHGVALLDDTGRAFGALCHFDLTPRFLSAAAFAEMGQAAIEIAAYLSRPGAARVQAELFEAC